MKKKQVLVRNYDRPTHLLTKVNTKETVLHDHARAHKILLSNADLVLAFWVSAESLMWIYMLHIFKNGLLTRENVLVCIYVIS